MDFVKIFTRHLENGQKSITRTGGGQVQFSNPQEAWFISKATRLENMNLTPFFGEFGRVLVEKATRAICAGCASRTGPYGTFGMEPASLKYA